MKHSKCIIKKWDHNKWEILSGKFITIFILYYHYKSFLKSTEYKIFVNLVIKILYQLESLLLRIFDPEFE